MGGEVEVLSSTEHVRQCAALMIGASPWSVLGFTYEGCLADLRSVEMKIHGVLDQESNVLAFIATMEHGIGFEPLVEYICVDERCRRSGFGTKLLTYVAASLFTDDANIYMFVSDINPDAERLYRRLGYERVGILPDYNIVGQTEFLLRLTRGPIRQPVRSK